jgi:hypothetical protein
MSRPTDEFPELREAMDVWREDASRASARFDAEGDLVDTILSGKGLAEKILAEEGVSATSSHSHGSRAPAAARAYAAAALVLIGLGIVGTVLARQASAEKPAAPRWAMLEEELIDVLTQDPQYEPGLGR